MVAATALSEDAVDAVANGDTRVERMLTAHPTASMIVDPHGRAIAGPLLGTEGILYAEIDLRDEIVAKQAHDIVGTYNRADIFQLTVDTRRHTPFLQHNAHPTPDVMRGSTSNHDDAAKDGGHNE